MKKFLASFVLVLFCINIPSYSIEITDSIKSYFFNKYKDIEYYTYGDTLQMSSSGFINVPNLAHCKLCQIEWPEYCLTPSVAIPKMWFMTDDNKTFYIEPRAILDKGVFYDIDYKLLDRNPVKTHPNIKTWSLIKRRKVRLGMTKDECKLSWGSPYSTDFIEKRHGTTTYWYYQDE